MKLVSFNVLLLCLALTVKSQKLHEDSFPFAPHFQTPSSILFSSDSSIYLPPESQSPIPYLQLQALNNINKLPYQYLPPSGTKAPPIYPTSFPMILSSTLKSNFEDEDDDNEDNETHNVNRRFMNLQLPSNNNHTSAPRQNIEKREFNPNNRMSDFPNPYRNFEVKSQQTMSNNKISTPHSINPAARRMIVTSEIQRADSGIDPMKSSASIQNSQHVHAPSIFISSTTETAVPILRLSNEMDLDGSFSYEALGADQTHYVQHSRMENMGTDKEEQVVEGSYSYVGDDGRTYTVHYVADSNGYRASGDHLPVPPPVPEIIQRAVQFNLAEEAKRPPHLKATWEIDSSEFQIGEESRQNVFHIPPPRNLFTGRTPEAFSFGLSQGPKPQNPVTVTNMNTPTKSNFQIISEQSKSKGDSQTPISPQITFLASQGTHNPSIQSHSPTKSISVEKSPLPQLINYEANIKERDQEGSKALWRWQYGLNANANKDTTNQLPNKNSISRSSGESDDIVINFNHMTSNQYEQMMQSQMLNQNSESNTIERNIEKQYSTPSNVQNTNIYNENKDSVNNLAFQIYSSTGRSDTKERELEDIKKEYVDVYSKLITSQNFIPQSQIATKSYTVDEASYEPTEISAFNENFANNFSTIYKIAPTSYNDNSQYDSLMTTPQERFTTTTTTTTTVKPVINYINNENHFDSFYDGKNTFKPILYNTEQDSSRYETTTTTEPPLEEMFKENMFLKNVIKPRNKQDKKNVEEIKAQDNKVISEQNIEKVSKYIPFQQHATNDIKYYNSKPFDISDVLNYVAMKNNFESIKTKPKSKPFSNNDKPMNSYYSQNSNLRDTSMHYIPVKDNNEERENNRQENDYRVNNQQQQEREVHGIIKNYKVLQRHKNTGQKSQIISEPQRHIKAFHTQGLPPLGRAGPSMKSYLPPTYV